MDFWRRHNVITGVVGALSWACSVVLPIALNVANADPVVQEAAKGRDTGANFLLKYQPPTVVDAPPPADPGHGTRQLPFCRAKYSSSTRSG